MSSTLDRLHWEFMNSCPSLTDVRERYFAHIRTDKHLLREIKAGRIQLKFTKLHGSIRANRVVHLQDLANYLDSRASERVA